MPLSFTRLQTYRAETERMDFHTESGYVLLFKLSRQVTLHEGSLLCRRWSVNASSLLFAGALWQ